RWRLLGPSRDVVVALPPTTETGADTAPPSSAGIDGGIVVSPLTPAAFGRLPPLVPDAPLPPAPDPALIQATSSGRLPAISADGRLPRDVYARPHDRRDERARLVIIISGIGLSRAASEAAIERSPGAVVLAIDAYTARPDDWARAARRSGHEILATIPLEDAGGPVHDEGPRALRLAASADENVQRLHAVLGSLTGYVGALAVGGTMFGEDAASPQSVLDELRGRGLLLVDATGTRETPRVRLSGPLGPPLIRVDVSIDDILGAASIDRQLADVETIAGQRSVGIALARPYPTTLERLRAWISALDERRFVLAPVSAVVGGDELP
ncbi:MAG: divergent polysaccharide deacetylase family protein, partial [Bacteroidota bacterium]